MSERHHYYYYHRHSRLPWKISAKIRAKLAAVLFLAYLLAVSGFMYSGRFKELPTPRTSTISSK
ncbi:MAG: hypothetical protein QXE06_01910 [Candidatus Bathyarchaeia archaeon]